MVFAVCVFRAVLPQWRWRH